MSKYIELLHTTIAAKETERDAALAKLEDIATRCMSESRSASPEEDAEAQALNERHAKLTDEIKADQAILAQHEATAEARKVSTPKPTAPTFRKNDDPYDIDLRSAPRTRDVANDIQSRALRALEIEQDLDDTQKHVIDGMLRNKRINRNGALARHVITTGRPEYRDAFRELTLRANPLLSAEQMEAVREVRGLQITTDASGGYLMPFTLDPTIILTNSGVINPIRDLATVITVATDNWQGVSSAGVTASYDAEESEVSDDTPTLAQPSIAVHQGQAFVPFSVQAEDDLDALSMDVAEMFADAKDRLELNAFTLGTGAGQPFGYITEATTVATTGADAYVVADVYKLQQNVAARHRSRGSWMMNLNVINLTRQFGTALGHQFLTDLGGGQPPQILGQNLYENSEMDGTIDAAATNKIVAYGDFKKYRIHDRIGMTVELVPHLFGANRRPTGQRGWYARFRHGARLVDTAAIKVLDA